MSGKQLEEKRSFCSYPFEHIFITNSGRQLPCCFTRNENVEKLRSLPAKLTEDPDLKDLKNSPFLKKIRRDFIEGRQPSVCSFCFNREAAGLESERSPHFQFIDPSEVSVDRDGHLNSKIKSLDLRLGNRCNLKCRMCHPASSSLLAKEWLKLGDVQMRLAAQSALKQKSWREDARFIQLITENREALTRLYIAGGEPMVILKQDDWIDRMIPTNLRPQIDLVINTNLTKSPREFVSRLSGFRSITLLGSIDAHGALNDYIRHPSQWTDTHRHLLEVLSLENENPQIKFHVIITVQIYNLLRTDQMLKELSLLGVRRLKLNILNTPTYFKFRHLPEDLKKRAREKVEFLIKDNLYGREISLQLEQILIALSQTAVPEEFRKFIQMTQKVDQTRKENFSEMVPEFKPYFSSVR